MWDTRRGEVSGMTSWLGPEQEEWRLFSEMGRLLQDGN